MQNALGLSGWTIHEIRDTEIMREYHATCDAQPAACPKCGVVAHLYRHGNKTVRYVDAPSWGKQSLLVARVQRYRCRSCDATFMQRLPDVDDSRQMTKRCMAYIEQQGVPQTFAALSRHIGVDEKTVRTICNSKFERQMSELKLEAPTILGIDELTLLKRKRTIFVDIGARRVIDIIESMDRRRVERWMWQLPKRENIKIVAIDMWGPYANAVRLLLPGAKVVVDKWHVLSKLNMALDRVRNRVRRGSKNPRRNPRQGKLLLQTSRHRLSPMRRMLVDAMLANNALLDAAWQAKETFYDVFDAKTRAEAEALYDLWVKRLPASIAPEFGPIVNMVDNWRGPIFTFFDYPVTNAVTEGKNGIIKKLNRAGNGYSFDTIRAKALMAEPLGKTAQCYTCKGHFPVASIRHHKLPVPSIGEDFHYDLCQSCDFTIFHTEHKAKFDEGIKWLYTQLSG